MKGGKTQFMMRLIEDATKRGETACIPCSSVKMLRSWKQRFDSAGISYNISAKIQKGLSGEYGSRRRLTIFTKPEAQND